MNPRDGSCPELPNSDRQFWCLKMDCSIARALKVAEGSCKASIDLEPQQVRLICGDIQHISGSAPLCGTWNEHSGCLVDIFQFEPKICKHHWARRSTRRFCLWFDILVVLKTSTNLARIRGTQVEEATRPRLAAEQDRLTCSPCRVST